MWALGGWAEEPARDDGAVIYLNAAEVWRDNLPADVLTHNLTGRCPCRKLGTIRARRATPDTADRSSLIRLWTIQPVSVWNQIEAQGTVYVDESRFSAELIEPYEWLRTRLRSRLASYTGRLLWWFYSQKPDLRGYGRFGEVCIEVLVARERVCVMRCWAWDLVRTQSYLPLTAIEHGNWRRAMRKIDPHGEMWPLPGRWQRRLERSWERVFSPRLPPSQPYVDGFSSPRGWSECEAVMECIHRSDVVRTHTIKRTPARIRPHVWVSPSRLTHLRAFAIRLHAAADSVSQYLTSRFSPSTRDLLAKYQYDRTVWRALRCVLANELNRIVEGDPIY